MNPFDSNVIQPRLEFCGSFATYVEESYWGQIILPLACLDSRVSLADSVVKGIFGAYTNLKSPEGSYIEAALHISTLSALFDLQHKTRICAFSLLALDSIELHKFLSSDPPDEGKQHKVMLISSKIAMSAIALSAGWIIPKKDAIVLSVFLSIAANLIKASDLENGEHPEIAGVHYFIAGFKLFTLDRKVT